MYLAVSLPLGFLVVFSVAAAACGSSASSPNGGSDAGSDGSRDGGATLPDGDSDAMVCPCFLKGRWKIDNVSPCLINLDGGNDGAAQLASATTISAGRASCPTDFKVKPTEPWSTDALTTDCPGHFTLCYALKAGDWNNPRTGDCLIAQVCTAGADYVKADQPQAWPVLPSWITTTAAEGTCASAFQTTGGYGEMTVTGAPTGCAPVTKTLTRVPYCPLACNATPNAPRCEGCYPAAPGTF